LTSITEKLGDRIEYGLLECADCRFVYPIVAGIPVLLAPEDSVDVNEENDARIIAKGPRPADLVRALKAGDHTEALGLLLTPPRDRGTLFPTLPTPGKSANQRTSSSAAPHPGHKRLLSRIVRRIIRPIRRQYWRLLLPIARRRLAAFLRSDGPRVSALDLIRLYYESFSGVEMFNYFACRFGQPRHLAALSLASLFRQSMGPLLDLACGMGHLTHYLTSACPGRPVFGIDRDFYRLYLAKHHVAPDATFVCAPADQVLPFDTGALSGVICSDAFHYFEHRAGSVREARRVLTEDGILIVCRFGNRDVEPREGYELPLEGYRRLFVGIPHVVLGEDDLVSRYLKRCGPDLRNEQAPDALRQQKWLSIVAGRDVNRCPPIHFEDWPHAAGHLQINPIYTSSDLSTGGRRLTFAFPSTWYAFENERYREYAAAECELSELDIQAIASRSRSLRLDELVNQFVVLGMPETYLCPQDITTPAEH
jgi:SAM-dependent methyltransferase/uncharacterized protein YbaR (Trm112 family)